MKRKKRKSSVYTPLILMGMIMMGFIVGDRTTHTSNPVTIEETISFTNAQQAMSVGVSLQDQIKDEYAKEVMDQYQQRKVIACSVSNLVREYTSEKLKQTFDHMTGYRDMVQFHVKEEMTVQFRVNTELEDVTVILLFPDDSYVVLEVNQEISCILPEGSSRILYIGQSLSGFIEVEICEDQQVSVIGL